MYFTTTTTIVTKKYIFAVLTWGYHQDKEIMLDIAPLLFN